MTTAEPDGTYEANRVELVAFLRSLDQAGAETPVPTCPGWTVKDVAAHMSGLVAETLAGVPPPRGSDEATARQTGDRASWSLADVCDEWDANAGALAEYALADPDYVRLLTCDLAVHGHDIAEALARPADELSAGTTFAAEHYLPLLQERAAAQLDVALEVELIDVGIRRPSAGTAALTLTASPFDFLRSVTGRRTRSQVAALDWSDDPTPVLGIFSQYAPLED